ncbi:MAG: leucine-rich repeat domain-containing protein, partial [Clostridia bacterium]|nr:leucine-rich repeat domain-containing protein [Clostridia bacterium]
TGKVHTKKKGSAGIRATITLPGGRRITRNITLTVLDEFDISDMTLYHYHGDGETVNGEEHVVVIPSGKNIMTIGEEAFKDNKVITKVIIPETVTHIDKKAFKGCTALKGVYFVSDSNDDYTADDFVAKSDLTLIDRNAFEGCTALETLDLRNVKVITIAREAFKDCESLKTIVKSSAIGTAYDRAFLGCKSLQSIDITGLHVAGANVFSGCEALSSITTARFTAIGRGMFTNLTYYYQVYDYQNSEWSDILEKEYYACNSLQNITVKATNVGAYAFANCTGLKTVSFEDETSVDGAKGNIQFTVGEGAFKGCTEITSVNFGNCTVRSIGAQAFDGCSSLSSVVLPEGLNSVGSGAFAGTNLATGSSSSYNIVGNAVFCGDTLILFTGSGSYTVPGQVNGETITKIGAYAFAGSNVTSVTIPATVTEIGEGAFAGSTLNSVTISASLKEIPAYAFYNTKLTQITLPKSVTYVGDYALANNTNLSTFTFVPDNNAEFGNFVFSGCTALQGIELNAKITQMGNGTFTGCTALRTVVLPNLTALGSYTFANTPALEEVTFGAGSTVTGSYTFATMIDTQYGIMLSANADGRKKLTSVTLGTSVSEIGEYAFYNCVNLASVDLGGVTTVKDYAFYGCTSLAVTGLENVEAIGNYAFADCSAITSLDLNSAKIIGEGAFLVTGSKAYNSLSIPVAVSVGAFAFSGGMETTVEIPATLKEIGEGAFSRSTKLTGFTVANGNAQYFAEDGVLYGNIDESSVKLVAYPSAKTVQASGGIRTYELLENTVKVEASAFQGLKSGALNKVILPYGLKAIGASAFYQSGITDYEFKGVTAPVLETKHSLVIDELTDAVNGVRGYYYNNFEGDFIIYAGIASGNVAPLTIHRPDNGTGYDNFVFTTFFGECVLTGITMNESVNSFIQFMKTLPTVQEVLGWNLSNKTEEEVKAFSDAVKTAHEQYNSFSSDENQMAFVNDACNVDDFFAVETALRAKKPTFNIRVSISRLTYTGDFKTEYKVGDTFDKTGLQIIIVYDDFSTEYADMNQVSFNPGPTDKLTTVDNVVTVSYGGKRVNIQISVTGSGSQNPDGGNNGDVDGGCGGGCGSTGSIGGTALMTFTAVGLMVLVSTFVRRRKQR